MAPTASLPRVRALAVAALLGAACGPVLPEEAAWPPLGKKWYERADRSFHTGDVEDAEVAIENALRAAGDREEVRLLAGRIALSQLEYDRAIQHLSGLPGSAAGGIRGRALWYAGRLEHAADELEKVIADPDVRDEWAKDVAKLARLGSGRTPFRMSGGLLAVTEMPRVSAAALIVPVELNGEPALAMVATGTAETVVDSGSKDPAWVSLRFAERVEVKDVPAVSRDLSGISRQVNAPIKMLLGVNLVRHLRPTFDLMGAQFVVRTFEPPPPPQATTVKLSYLRGGGMLLRGSLGSDSSAPALSLLVDTSWSFPMALDDGGWRKAGISPKSLETVPSMSQLRHGVVPMVRVGAFELPQVTSVYGLPIDELEKGLDVDLDGLVGAGLFAPFRVTLADGGRTLWLEDFPREAYRSAAPPPESDGDDDGAPEPSPPSGPEPSAPPPPAAPVAPAAPGGAPPRK